MNVNARYALNVHPDRRVDVIEAMLSEGWEANTMGKISDGAGEGHLVIFVDVPITDEVEAKIKLNSLREDHVVNSFQRTSPIKFT